MARDADGQRRLRLGSFAIARAPEMIIATIVLS
jgi:hypothetical protein